MLRILPKALLCILTALSTSSYCLHGGCTTPHLDGDLLPTLLLVGWLPLLAPSLVECLHLLALLLRVVPELAIAQSEAPSRVGRRSRQLFGVHPLEGSLRVLVELVQLLSLLAHLALRIAQERGQGHPSLSLLQTAGYGCCGMCSKDFLLVLIKILGANQQPLHASRVTAIDSLIEGTLNGLHQLGHAAPQLGFLLLIWISAQVHEVVEKSASSREVHILRDHGLQLLQLGGSDAQRHGFTHLLDPGGQRLPSLAARDGRPERAICFGRQL
mmetsp:Transcript_12617/g.29958  ORF Transcript_12617/g.29958 Transcript_12617/m.29958 type:complete len:271 (+) Transcript_12617:2325-3137(+)